MLDLVLKVSPPVVLLVGMLGVGLSIDRSEVFTLIRTPGKIAMLTALQLVLLPATGVAVVCVLDMPSTVLLAILLIASCPGGGISNLYVWFARANVSISVILTLMSVALASLTIPLNLEVLKQLGFLVGVPEVSTGKLSVRLISLILIPVTLGMVARAWSPDVALQWQARLRAASSFMIVAIVAAVLWLERASIAATLPAVIMSALTVLAIALLFGWLAGRILYYDGYDRFAVMTEFGVRNLAIGTVVAATLGQMATFASAAAVYLMLETTVLMTMGFARRKRIQSLASNATSE